MYATVRRAQILKKGLVLCSVKDDGKRVLKSTQMQVANDDDER